MVPFVLASGSPARLRLLRQAGIDPIVRVSGVDEEAIEADLAGSPIPEIAAALARAKAAAVAADADLPPGCLVLGCDSIFEMDGVALGKPPTPEEALRRWRRMRGRAGVLHTGHCLVDVATGSVAEEVVGTTVRMGDAEDAEIEHYIATGEPLDVAGGFTLDGLGAPFVAGVDGDPGNVIGVSLPAVRRLARDLGWTWPEVLG